MTLARLFATWDGTRRLNALLGATVLAQGAAIGALAVVAVRAERTVTMVPPDIHAAVSVRRGQADPAFHEAWGAYFAGVLGNVTPGNARFVRQSLEPFLCPEIFHEVVQAVEREGQQMLHDRVSTRFTPQRVLHEAASGKTFVQGQFLLDSAAGARRASERTFELRVRVENYLPQLCWVASYAGPPRTLDAAAAAAEQQRGGSGGGASAATPPAAATVPAATGGGGGRG